MTAHPRSARPPSRGGAYDGANTTATDIAGRPQHDLPSRAAS